MRKLLWTYAVTIREGEFVEVDNVDQRLNGIYCIKLSAGGDMYIEATLGNSGSIPSTTTNITGTASSVSTSSYLEFWLNSIASFRAIAKPLGASSNIAVGVVIECWSNE